MKNSKWANDNMLTKFQQGKFIYQHFSSQMVMSPHDSTYVYCDCLENNILKCSAFCFVTNH